MPDELKWENIASTFIGKAKPCANILLLLNDVRNARKGEYDPSILGAVEQYKKLLDPSKEIFGTRPSKIVQKIFFERSIRDEENFRWLVNIPNEEILELLVCYVSGKGCENLPIFKKLLNDFFQGRDVNEPRFVDFINCTLGYFSVLICSNSESRDSLMISILGDIQQSITDKIELKDDFNLSAEIAAASISSHFKDNFSSSLLNYAALKVHAIDKEYLNRYFFERYISANCPENATENDITENFLMYLSSVSIDELEENLCNVLNTFAFNYKGKLASVKDRVCDEFSFCFALKMLSDYDEFVVNDCNIYEKNESLMIKCFSKDRCEIELIVSSITKNPPEFRSENPNILIGEVGFNKNKIIDEVVDEAACNLTADISKSVYNGGVRSNVKINKRLIASSKFDHPLYFYIVLEENNHGEEIANKLASEFPLIRFVMRSDDENSLRFTEIESYHDFVDAIQTYLN